jgi:hypothetical protein
MITKISMRKKATILALISLTAFLVPLGVRATNPPPLTTVVNVSTVTYGAGGCSGTNGIGVKMLDDIFSIPAGHSAYILPPVYTAIFSSTASDAFFSVVWYVNSTELGQTNSYGLVGGANIGTSFGQEVISSSALSFFNTAHAGPVTYDFSVWDGTVSGARVCTQIPYLSLALVET